MRLLFKAEDFCFYTSCDDTPVAQALLKHLPLVSNLLVKNRYLFLPLSIQLPEEEPIGDMHPGTLFYRHSDSSLVIYLGEVDKSDECSQDKEMVGVVLGKLLTSIDELRNSAKETQVLISSISEAEYYGDRKLTQSEIDVLVSELLDKKKKIK